MEKRRLGKSDLIVSPITFGCNVFGWTADEKTSFDLLDHFVAQGFNLLDTADIYAQWATGVGGESETIIGKWLKKTGKRKDVIIATKCGMVDMKGTINISKKYIIESCEKSLKRLQTGCIDLYQTHKDDEKTPLEEVLSAYDQLIKEGKVRWIGASNFGSGRLAEAIHISEKNNLPRYQTLQPLYNLYDRAGVEKELEPLCVKENISIINYYSLGAGFLTGKYRNETDFAKSPRAARVKSFYWNDRGFRILKAMDEVAAEYKTSLSSIAIAWLLQRPAVGAPIASATSIKQMDDMLAAVNLHLKAETIQKLDEASAW